MPAVPTPGFTFAQETQYRQTSQPCTSQRGITGCVAMVRMARLVAREATSHGNGSVSAGHACCQQLRGVCNGSNDSRQLRQAEWPHGRHFGVCTLLSYFLWQPGQQQSARMSIVKRRSARVRCERWLCLDSSLLPTTLSCTHPKVSNLHFAANKCTHRFAPENWRVRRIVSPLCDVLICDDVKNLICANPTNATHAHTHNLDALPPHHSAAAYPHRSPCRRLHPPVNTSRAR